MSYVLDASAILALAFNEPGAERVAAVLPQAVVSSVNLSEAAAKLIEKGAAPDAARLVLEAMRLEIIPLDWNLGWEAALLRQSTKAMGLSLGDRVCLALAARRNCVALTADRTWSGVSSGPKIEVIR